MYKRLLERISTDIDWMALTPLLLFFVVFAFVVVVVFMERKGHYDYMSELPLKDDPDQIES